MRGFVSGVFWGLVTAAVVLVVVALRAGAPTEAEPEVEVVEPALAPTTEATDPEGEVIVTTDPAAEPATEPDPAEPDPVEAEPASGVAQVSPDDAPAEATEADAPPPATAEPPADPEPASAAPAEEDGSASAPAPVEPADGGDAVDAPGAEVLADVETHSVESREDGTVVIRQTVPVEPLQD